MSISFGIEHDQLPSGYTIVAQAQVAKKYKKQLVSETTKKDWLVMQPNPPLSNPEIKPNHLLDAE